MKVLSLLAFICLTFLSSQAQIDSLHNFNKFEYDGLVRKQKNAKVTAYILTGTGVILGVVVIANGLADAASALFDRNYQSRNLSPLFYSSIGLMFASIPFYIKIIRLKHKATLLLQEHPMEVWNSFDSHKQVNLGITISLN